MGPEDRQFPEFFVSQYGRLRLEAKHAGRERAEPFDLGPHEELMVVRAAIRRLPARQRTVLVLRYHQDLPEQEVARLLRIPVGTVKSLSNRAMTRLRRDLERQLPDRADTGGHPREPRGPGPGGIGRGGQGRARRGRGL